MIDLEVATDIRNRTLPNSAKPHGSTALRNIQPNPFNPTAIVSFDLATEQRVRLQVFDMHGALVRTLVDGTSPAGPKRVTWDGKDQHGSAVSSGIYVFRLVSREVTQSRKAVLVR